MIESSQTNKLQPNFQIGNLATDLVDLTLEYCTRYEDQNPRFPKRMYESYVTQIVNLSLQIHKNICEANSIKTAKQKRHLLQEISCGDCTSLEKLIFIALKRGWISKKQHIRWQSLICDLHFKITKWLK